MAADFYIHLLTDDFTEKKYAQFRSNALGSKYFTGKECDVSIYDEIDKTPNVWVGEVSWLKATIFDASEDFIPTPIEKLNELIGEEFPTIDDEFIRNVREAMTEPNTTGYSLSSAEDVIQFLEKNKGERLFSISW